ncbi:General transcription factor IIH subunit 4 [Geodia barretti]|uniref:General transcription factor IIH subunit 4 n=1 Tax=Geodia barretti TaxID=519541 RepID=A0AA35RU92_GEOBA|nr:General transcription factor IIH subunit 4 [Geodia barretti]
MEEAKIVCKDLLSYLEDLPTSVLISLYGYSSACLAVFSYHREAITKLQRLHVYKTSPLPGGQQGVSLHEDFRRNLRILLCGGGTPWALVGHRGGEDKHARDIAFLNDYADKQWELK